MSSGVALASLVERIAEFGPVAYLVTVGTHDVPHVVAVRVAWDGDRLAVRAGRTSSTNVEKHPAVTLVWAAPVGGDYSLIVDGTARPSVDGEGTVLGIDPTGAVLHRTPDGDSSAPSCIRLLPSP